MWLELVMCSGAKKHNLMAHIDFDRINRILGLAGLQQIAVSDSQPHTALKVALKSLSPSLLGTSNAEISQWLSVSKELSESPKDSPRLLKSLNSFLVTRSFLVGNSLTIADYAVFEPLANLSLSAYPEVNRWSLFIRSKSQQNTSSSVILPTIFPVLKKQSPVAPSPSSVAPTESEPVKTEAKTEVKGEAKTGEASQKEEKQQSKKEKSKKEKSSETKTETSAPSASAAPSEESELDPSKLDFRVGVVLKCWDHPEADKLLCEDVDIGEATGPRKIASGLRAHYSATELEGKKVIVLANLKDRTMVGFKSQGMIVCASNSDHTIVKLLEPPTESNAGDRVTFDGFTGEPASASVVAKKKILEKLIPEMKTNDEGIPMCVSKPFKIGSAFVRSPISNGTVG